jgi:hypothetical protein
LSLLSIRTRSGCPGANRLDAPTSANAASSRRSIRASLPSTAPAIAPPLGAGAVVPSDAESLVRLAPAPGPAPAARSLSSSVMVVRGLKSSWNRLLLRSIVDQ